AIFVNSVELLERRLARTLQPDERLRESFAAIHRQLARLQSLIGSMFDASYIQRGQLSIVHEPLNFASLVRTVVDDMRPSAPGQRIEVHTPTEALMVRGDAVRLSEVVLNLLHNAIKYSPEGGPIRVEVTRAHDRAVLAVTDFGIGIPPDVVPHLFERFYRA